MYSISINYTEPAELKLVLESVSREGRVAFVVL